jgi:8-oxo-dGTP diphosphatase
MNTQAGAWAVIHCPETRNFLLGRRSEQVNKPNLWNLFGGHIGSNEQPVEALARELAEETGLRLASRDLIRLGGVEGAEVHEIGYVNALRELHYFLLLTRSEIEPVLNYEHSEFRWFSADKLPGNVNRPTAIALSIGLVQKVLEEYPRQGAVSV